MKRPMSYGIQPRDDCAGMFEGYDANGYEAKTIEMSPNRRDQFRTTNVNGKVEGCSSQ